MILDKFNFSYSTYETYCKSQLWFYFLKIAKVKETDVGMQVYGDAGNVVHNAMEDFINDGTETFYKHWEDYDIDNKFGFKNSKLSKDKYSGLFMSLQNYYLEHIPGNVKTELKIEKKFFGMTFKGFIDLYTEVGDEIILYDWKTNSKHDYKLHLKQRLLYSWFIWKIKGIIPTCKWIYAVDMDVVKDKFSVVELNSFENEILQFIDNIQAKGTNIDNYSAGEYKNPFNKYYTICKETVEDRQEATDMNINLVIKGHFVFLEGDVHPKLPVGIDFATKFDLPDKFWMQQQIRKNGRGRMNLEDVGTVHLFNTKFKCFPIGLLGKVIKICKEFGQYYRKKVTIFIDDNRDKKVMEQKLNVMPFKLKTDKKLRDYQQDAVYDFFANGAGIINIATGGGKTFVATEIIKQADAKTLWIIDRKELLIQTKEVLEELLGIEVGTIMNGEINIKEVTIATIQSLNSKLPELQEYLYNVNFVCVDEFHKSAAESYQKVFSKLPNTKYRLGLTATPQRDDGKGPILFSILGDIVSKVTTEDLIEWGYLVKPKIIFHEILQFGFENDTYADDYKCNIVKSSERNNKIKQICDENLDKKIIILTKQVEHGKSLQEMLPGSRHIYGTMKKAERELTMETFRIEKQSVLIMTVSIGAEGLDIPDLDIIINASANKGDVKSIQILGRVLRIFKNKDTAIFIDFLDGGKYTRKHSQARMKALRNQGHDVEIA